MLGHSYQQCLKYDDVTPVSELPYGMWLRASPTKRRRTVDYKREEEIKICQHFKGTLRESKAKTKLNFHVGVRNLGFDEADPSNNDVVQVYENPIAGDAFEKGGSRLDQGVEIEGELVHNSRFLKRGRTDPVVKNNANDPIFDTIMLENSGNAQIAAFSYVNGGNLSSAVNDLSAVIGGDQTRRTQ